jgi:small subunit ribosomal protein S20
MRGHRRRSAPGSRRFRGEPVSVDRRLFSWYLWSRLSTKNITSLSRRRKELASHSSAQRNARRSEKLNLRNRVWKSKLKTLRKKLEEAITEKKSEVVGPLYTSYTSAVDMAASRGVLHKKNAARKKSRMAHKVNSLKNVG